MKRVPATVIIASLYVIFFQIAPYIGVADEVMFILFFLSPFVVIYMAYVILKYGKPGNNTFDERFYDDWDYRRNGKEEMDKSG